MSRKFRLSTIIFEQKQQLQEVDFKHMDETNPISHIKMCYAKAKIVNTLYWKLCCL